jgi:hypothetical protein
MSSLYLLTYKIPYPKQLIVANRQLSLAGLVTYATNLLINLNRHKEL